jgi:hypothetical protein
MVMPERSLANKPDGKHRHGQKQGDGHNKAKRDLKPTARTPEQLIEQFAKANSKADELALEALGDMNAELRRKAEECRSCWDAINLQSVKGVWKFGAQCSDIIRDQTENGEKTYGARAMTRLALVLQASESYLYGCERMHRSFTEEKLEQLTGLTMKGGKKISLSHFRVLVMVEDEGLREQVIDLLVKHGWRSDQLRDYLWSQFQIGRGPRKKKPDQTAAFQTDMLLHSAEEICTRFETVISSEDRALLSSLRELQPENYSEVMITKILDIAGRYRDMAEKAQAAAKEMEDSGAFMTRVREHLKHQLAQLQSPEDAVDDTADIDASPAA